MTPYPARLFRIELKRNVTWPLLPVLAGLLWVASPYGRTLKAPVVLWSSRPMTAAQIQGALVDLAARAITGVPPIQEQAGARPGKVESAQLDVAFGLELVAGTQIPPAAPAPVAAAARHFAALPELLRHRWLAAHLPALRAGRIALADLP